jgi:hypothetical protein
VAGLDCTQTAFRLKVIVGWLYINLLRFPYTAQWLCLHHTFSAITSGATMLKHHPSSRTTDQRDLVCAQDPVELSAPVDASVSLYAAGDATCCSQGPESRSRA